MPGHLLAVVRIHADYYIGLYSFMKSGIMICCPVPGMYFSCLSVFTSTMNSTLRGHNIQKSYTFGSSTPHHNFPFPPVKIPELEVPTLYFGPIALHEARSQSFQMIDLDRFFRKI